MSKLFIEALGARIESLLPNRTGYTVAEVELNPQFLITRKLLLLGDHEGFVLPVFQTFCSILRHINRDAGEIDLRQRTENSLSLTIVVLKLFFEFANKHWSSKRSLKNNGFDVNVDRPFNFSTFFHYDIPTRMSDEVVEPCISTLILLLLPQMVRRALLLVRRAPNPSLERNSSTPLSSATSQTINSSLSHGQANYHPSNYPPLSHSAHFQDDMVLPGAPDHDKAIQDIEKYCLVILKFISVANPETYCGYLEKKLFSYSRLGQQVPTQVLHKYAPLLEYVFYTEDVSVEVATDMTNFLPYVKLSVWRQVVLMFFANSIKDQCLSRPEDYHNIIRSGTALQQNNNAMFDHILTVLEGNLHLGAGLMVLAWLIVTCVTDFEDFQTKPNKLKVAFNKRLKFLAQILKDLKEQANLELFDSLINIFYLAAKQGDKEHTVYKFAYEYLDTTIELLHSISVSFLLKEALELYDTLLINMNIVSIIIKPEKYTPILLQKFASPLQNVHQMKFLVKIVKGLLESRKDQVNFEGLISKLSPNLKSMISSAAKVLTDETAVSRHRRPSQTSLSGTVVSPPNYLSPTSTKMPATIDEEDQNTNKSVNLDNSSLLTSLTRQHRIENTEEVLADLFDIFIKAPQNYFFDVEEDTKFEDVCSRIQESAMLNTMPMKTAFLSSNEVLFEASASLAMALISQDFQKLPMKDALTICASLGFLIHHISEVCLQLSLTDSKIKWCFMFLNKFLEKRLKTLAHPKFKELLIQMSESKRKEFARFVTSSLEKIILLSLCTHDLQFYNMAKTMMSWYVREIDSMGDIYTGCYNKDLYEKFIRIINDGSIFTGFVSLHKKFRNLMREFEPSADIFEVWQLIYERWIDMLASRSNLDDENLVFRHYTGFLVLMSGLFLVTADNQWEVSLLQILLGSEQTNSSTKLNISNEYKAIINFFEKCIQLLTESDVVVRVIVKDALSNEDHPSVYHLICTKLVEILKTYVDDKVSHTVQDLSVQEKILFSEQVVFVLTCMINVNTDGAFVLSTLLPSISVVILKFIATLDDTPSVLKLKIRMCKLFISVEGNKSKNGFIGAIKWRNHLAKTLLEWLKQLVIFEEEDHIRSSEFSKLTSSASVVSGGTTGSNTLHLDKRLNSEQTYLLVDLATDSSKALSYVLEQLPLEIPDGTRDKDIPKSKEVLFTTYFSVFFKILLKFSSGGQLLMKLKYKLHLVSENALKCILNILQEQTDIGMPFVLPLCLSSNPKIRLMFIGIVAEMFAHRRHSEPQGEYPENIYEDMSDYVDLCGTAAQVALTGEYNLLALSLFAIFGYTKRLDVLLSTLLNDDMSIVSRPTEIFRRNSTLTRILLNFGKDYGLEYLKRTLLPLVNELASSGAYFEVEKESDSEVSDESINEFITYMVKLVNAIKQSFDFVPQSFKYICHEIYHCAKEKNAEEALTTVGSFLFLRFFCPAVVNPEVFLGVPIKSPKMKRNFMQLGKVLQNMANGSLSLLRWSKVQSKIDILNDLNNEVANFLKEMSFGTRHQGYAFQEVDTFKEPPVAELRYLHKFIYYYFSSIKHDYIFGELLGSHLLSKRIQRFRKFDILIRQLSLPKLLLVLQIKPTFNKSNVQEDTHVGDFVSKLAIRYNDLQYLDVPLVNTAISSDGTPTVIANLVELSNVNSDVQFLVYRIFEICLQVWDNDFYLVYDFSGAEITGQQYQEFSMSLKIYAPDEYFNNCTGMYFFALPFFLQKESLLTTAMLAHSPRISSKFKIHLVTQPEGFDISDRLGLSAETKSIYSDARVVYPDVSMWDPEVGRYVKVSIKIGRKWLQVLGEESVKLTQGAAMEAAEANGVAVLFGLFDEKVGASSGFDPNNTIPRTLTSSYKPLILRKLSSISKCEANNDNKDEFIVHLHDCVLLLKLAKRSEILRFLYLSTSRLSREPHEDEASKFTLLERTDLLWFCRLYQLVFQGLLSEDEEVRSITGNLFAALSHYFDLDLGILYQHARNIALPANITDFIVSTSSYLSRKHPSLLYRFIHAFFEYYEKLPKSSHVLAIMSILPWIRNITDHVYLSDRIRGTTRTIDVVRQFCRILSQGLCPIPILNDYIWKNMFGDSKLVPLLIDEVIAYAVDARNSNDPNWELIIAVISPSIEVCGELIKRLYAAVYLSTHDHSTIISQLKIVEISVIVRMCLAVFFDLHTYAHQYAPDVFFFATLFVLHQALNIGTDLQQWCSNTVQLFLHKPNLTIDQSNAINNTLNYILGQRAHLLFGSKRDSEVQYDINQMLARATSLEVFCDKLYQFMLDIGTSQDILTRWRSRWCTSALDVAFRKVLLFQLRLILIVGILLKVGLSDALALRVLKLIAKQKITNPAYLCLLLVSMARILEGLDNQLVLPPIIIWPLLCLSNLNNMVTYLPAVQCLSNVVLKLLLIKKDISELLEMLVSSRQMLEPYVSDFENAHEINFLIDNLEHLILFTYLKGIRVSQLRHLSVTCLKAALLNRVTTEQNIFDVNKWATAYLVFINLLSSDVNFDLFIDQLGFKEAVNEEGNSLDFVISKLLKNDVEVSKLTLVLAAKFFLFESMDSVYNCNFLRLYNRVMHKNRDLGFLVLHILKDSLQKTISTSSSIEEVENAAELLLMGIEDKKYLANHYQKVVSELTKLNHLPFTSTNTPVMKSGEEDLQYVLQQDVKGIFEMLYRGACCYVEGLRLED